jgi:NADH:ubiquinone reductase (H+-translocating)
MNNEKSKTRVIIIGAGFAGLSTAQALAKHKHIETILVDRNNYHTFTPLLYQVATCGLDPSSIAYPIRSIFRNLDNVHSLMGEVIGINYVDKIIDVKTNGTSRQEFYDYLLIAAGSVTNFFGISGLKKHSFEMKSLSDSVKLRQHILRLFERAAWTDDEDYKSALLTMVVVGGGATGIETAGAMFELYNHVLKQEYDDRQELKARVILLEASDGLLAPYPEELRESAKKQLESVGVEVMTNAQVSDAGKDFITLQDGRDIKTHTIVWSAGVKASSLADMLQVDLNRGGRVPVKPTIEVIGRDNVFVAGDMAYLEDDKGEPYPMLIPVANQQGKLVAENILNKLKGKPESSFKYNDRGIMATIGRTRAVAWIFYRVQLTGFLAWVAWLFLHLIMLMGFKNRVSAFMNWMWNYFTYDRSVRIILQADVKDNIKETE